MKQQGVVQQRYIFDMNNEESIMGILRTTLCLFV